MGKIYRFLGLSVAVVKSTDPPWGRKRLYKCDIVYVTAQSLCFTYLQDNTAIYKESVVSSSCRAYFNAHALLLLIAQQHCVEYSYHAYQSCVLSRTCESLVMGLGSLSHKCLLHGIVGSNSNCKD